MINIRRFLIVYILIIMTALYLNFSNNVDVPMNKQFREFPVYHKEWKMISESFFDENMLKKLQPTDYMLRTYTGPDKLPVHLYIGYHNGGKDSGEVHSPKNCLPGGGWYKLKEDKMVISNNLKKINLVRAIYQKGENKELFIYWYNVRGNTLSNMFSLKLAQIINSILDRRKDTAFIRVSVPYEASEDEAFAVGKEFIKDFYPTIVEFLPR